MKLKINSHSSIKISRGISKDQPDNSSKKREKENPKEKSPKRKDNQLKQSESLKHQLAIKKSNQTLNFLENIEFKLQEVQEGLEELAKTLYSAPLEKVLPPSSENFQGINLTFIETLDSLQTIKKDGSSFMDQEFFHFGDWIEIIRKCEEILPSKNLINSRPQIDTVETLEVLQKVQASLFPFIQELNKKKKTVKVLLKGLISNYKTKNSVTHLLEFLGGGKKELWDDFSELHPHTKPIKSIE